MLDILKTISILLPILITLVGVGNYVYAEYQEPDLGHGKYFTNAWLEYGKEQNILYVEYIPDYKGNGLKAMGEALCKIAQKMNVNSQIDSKPILVIGSIRYKTELLEYFRVVVHHEDYEGFCDAPIETRKALLDKLATTTEVTYNKSTIMIAENNKVYFREALNGSAEEQLDQIGKFWE